MRARPGRGLMTGLDARSLISQRIARPITLFLTLYVGVAVTIWVIESGLEGSKITTIQDALWWSLVTLSTVGYGDTHPVSGWGRLLASGYILATVVFIAVVLTNIQDAMREYSILREQGMTGNSMEDHVIVCGWSNISRVCVPELIASGRAVSVVCEEEDMIQKVRQSVEHLEGTLFVTHGDMTTGNVMKRANLPAAQTVIIASEDDTINLITSLNIHNEHPDMRVIVYVRQPEMRRTFDASGVTYVASPFELGGRLVASAAFEPEVALLIDDVSSSISGHDIQQFTVGDGSTAEGMTIEALRVDLLTKGGPLLIAIGVPNNGGWDIVPNPSQQHKITKGTILMVLGHHDECRILTEMLGLIQGR